MKWPWRFTPKGQQATMRQTDTARVGMTHLPCRMRWTAVLLLGGVGYAGQSALYFASLNRNPASINSLLLYVYPVFVALLSWRFNLVRPSRREFGALVIARKEGGS